MPDQNSTDLLMAFQDDQGNWMSGEGTTVFDATDAMMANFVAGSIFEVEEFTFSSGIEDDAGSEAEEESDTEGALDNEMHSKGSTERKKGGKSGKSKKKIKKFKRFVENGPPQAGELPLGYDVHLEEITIERQMDKASMPLLGLCLNQKVLTTIVLVKRKFTGRQAFHEAFLRLEFKQPLITSVEWKEGEVIKETLKFVYRGIVASYKPQKPDGSLGDAIPTSFDYDTASV